MPFDYFKPYPEDKNPQLDFGRKFGQIRDASMTEQAALRQVFASPMSFETQLIVLQMLSLEAGDRPQTLKEIKECVLFRGV